jgi:hypothetical protein
VVEPAKNKHGIYRNLIILLVVAIINALLSHFAAVAWPSAPGIAALYFAVAFMIPFTLWFGAWGAIAAYAGCVIGVGLFTMPLSVNLYWSLADLWQVLIPLVAFRRFHADVGLKTGRDFLIFLIFGWLLNNLAGAVWGSTMLSVGGISTWNSVPNTLVVWFAGNLIVTMVITTALLKYVTPYIAKPGLLVKEYWF